ncbi:hypothetical protein BDR03DRAFT_960418 [Suillus americanus]|nr:hypothetical protein BDR03DRAFT_960418 [Suillus americanus]
MSFATRWCTCIQCFNDIYLFMLAPSLRIAPISSPVRLLSPSVQLFFHAPQLTASYTHRFHSALVLTAFVVDIAITCCTVQ